MAGATPGFEISCESHCAHQQGVRGIKKHLNGADARKPCPIKSSTRTAHLARQCDRAEDRFTAGDPAWNFHTWPRLAGRSICVHSYIVCQIKPQPLHISDTCEPAEKRKEPSGQRLQYLVVEEEGRSTTLNVRIGYGFPHSFNSSRQRSVGNTCNHGCPALPPPPGALIDSRYWRRLSTQMVCP